MTVQKLSLDTEVVVPLKYLSNFCRSLDFPLINCEIKLYLSWLRYCIIFEISETSRTFGNPPIQQMTTRTTSVTFRINNPKLYVPLVTLPINDNINFLENMKQGFKRTISWKKYRSEIKTQTNSNNFDYFTDPIFLNINRLFVVSFNNGNDMLLETLLMSITCH